jgi:hypothetical protein
MRVREWIIVVLAVSGLLQCAGASPEGIGVITALKGPVTIQRGGTMVSPRLGDAIEMHDVITTGIGGGVKILFQGRVISILGENTSVEITQHFFDTTVNRRDSVFSLRSGLIRSLIEKFTKDSRYIIGTDNAIAGVKGTDFLVRYTPGRRLTQVYVLEEGEVEVRNRLEAVTGFVTLSPNQWTEVAGKNAPEPARVLTKVSADALRSETLLPDQVDLRSREKYKAGAGADVGKNKARKLVEASSARRPAVNPQNPQVDIVGQDFILPSGAIPGAAAGAQGLSPGGAGAAGARGALPGGGGGRVGPGGRPGSPGGLIGAPGGEGQGGGLPGLIGK